MHGDTLATTSTTRFAYKLVGIDYARIYAGGYIDYSSRLQNYSESTPTSGLHRQFKIQRQLANILTRGLAPLTTGHILCDSSSSQAWGLDMTRVSAMMIACHDSLDPLFQNLRTWIQGSGAAGYVSSATYFSNLL
jgi:hypothetical protein